MTAILKRELRTYFNSMIGYIFIGLFVLITAIYFSIYNLMLLNSNFEVVLSSVTVIFLILVPVITMRLLSEEARQKTDQLLLTSPIKVIDIILAKYFAAVILFMIALFITSVFPFMLIFFGDVNFPQVFVTYLGFFFMGICFIAVGIWISSLTDNQIVAAIGSFGILFLLFMVENIAVALPIGRNFSIIFISILALAIIMYIYNLTKNLKVFLISILISCSIIGGIYFAKPEFYDGLAYKIVSSFAIVSKFSNFAIGILDLNAIIYYITFSMGFIYLTIKVVEKRRWN